MVHPAIASSAVDLQGCTAGQDHAIISINGFAQSAGALSVLRRVVTFGQRASGGLRLQAMLTKDR
jgi:hypothetical protein